MHDLDGLDLDSVVPGCKHTVVAPESGSVAR